MAVKSCGEIEGLLLDSIQPQYVNECVTECPECNAGLERTIRVRNIDENVQSGIWQLRCTACEETFELPNTSEQRTVLTNRSHHPCKKDPIMSIEDVGIGEIISFDIITGNGTTTHIGVCVEINQETNKIVVIKVATDEYGEKSIKKKPMTMEFLRRKSAFVFRYKPLDCRPQEKTVQKAQTAFAKGFVKWAAGSNSDDNIDQQFVNWCKTGRREGIQYTITEVVQRCPRCQAKLSRSTLKMWLRNAIVLECQVCSSENQISRTDDQVKLLSRSELDELHEIEPLNSIDDVDRADKIVYKGKMCCTHPVIVTSVRKHQNLIEVVDLKKDKNDSSKIDIRSRYFSFDKLKAKGATIHRYLPLDCLPADLTVDRALKHAHDKYNQNFKQFKNNCQHFANWCKIGIRRSEDVDNCC